MFRKLRYFLILKAIKHLTPHLYLSLKHLSNHGLLQISNWKSKRYNSFKEHIRPSIKFMKKYFKNKGLIGVEIGVREGNNALYILNELNIKKLYLIDIWQSYNSFNKDYDNSISFDLVQKLFNKNKKVKIIKNFSLNACKTFKNNSLDFVYIDANHQYDYIYNDIKNWYNKIKINGILSGHDINIKDVFNALVDYCTENKVKFFIEQPDWYIIKKEKEKEKEFKILLTFPLN